MNNATAQAVAFSFVVHQMTDGHFRKSPGPFAAQGRPYRFSADQKV
ncbi:hypothetical protein [Pseudomonas xantholysinigenes]|uniref:Uncharacterized protein n=1 Tax=Pseudomonas xantholysinigenes TaxID=2745490 RepID=A0A9E6TY79_9PSED|nr:hypothetical protein [Pseudomonas xantholysinigenes]QXI38755.1 hypothetical protein HU772_001255 [Pseudomonas xantholysinigenes]